MFNGIRSQRIVAGCVCLTHMAASMYVYIHNICICICICVYTHVHEGNENAVYSVTSSSHLIIANVILPALLPLPK